MSEECENPLFAGWLREWMEVEVERNTKGRHTYRKAYQAMKACPIKLQHASQADQLSYIGPKLCKRLADKHIEYCESNGLPRPKKPSRKQRTSFPADGAQEEPEEEPEEPEEPPKKKRKQQEYIPKLRSGAWALIMALSDLDEEGKQALNKPELTAKAQPLCDSSFTIPSDTTKYYTAWKSMETLLQKEFVITKGHPSKRYYLSDDGWDVANRMKAVSNGETVKPRPRKGKETDSATKPAKTPNSKPLVRALSGSADVVDIDSDSEPEPYTTPLRKLIPIKDSGASAKRQSLTYSLSSVPIVLNPGTFEVKLLLDNREIRSKNDRDYISKELRRFGIAVATRALPLGDALWIAELKPPHDSAFRSRNAGDDDEGSNEIVLEHIVERKRLDDLVSSIKDGRFHEQKFRLKKSGMRHVTYLVEDFSMSAERQEHYGDSLNSAIASMQIVNDIFVKQTAKIDASIKYLEQLTRSLKQIYEDKDLHVLPSRSLDVATYHSILHKLRDESPTNAYCITFSAFCALCDKSDSLTLRDVYLKMLMCIQTVTGDKAIEIQKIWPTPNALIEAYERLAYDKKAQDNMISDRLGNHPVSRKKIGKSLSTKIAEVFVG